MGVFNITRHMRAAITAIVAAALASAKFHRQLGTPQTVVQAGDTIADTILKTAFASTITIPANTLVANGDQAMFMYGFSLGVTGTPTIAFEVALGAVTITPPTSGTLATGGASAAGNGGTATLWITRVGTNLVEYNFVYTMGTRTGSARSTAQTALDLTIDNIVSLSVTWSAQSPSNTISQRLLKGSYEPVYS